jgi:two-component system, cell cycle sensor histidine kinase and response regulator CckA
MLMGEGIDGAETYRRILELRPDQRAIVLTGFAGTAQIQEALHLGAGAYLRKPVTRDQLARAVRHELDRTEIRD